MSLKLISGKAVADKAYDQYSSLKGEMEVANIDFSMKIGRLDDFYFKKMKVSKFLTLSHGQTDVERGFSVNNDVLQDNIQEDLIISKRLVKDFLNSLIPSDSGDHQPDASIMSPCSSEIPAVQKAFAF